MAHFYQIYISPRHGITREQVQTIMDQALDWFRYDDKCWVVYTTVDAKKWYSRFEKYVEPGGSMFVCKLDPSDYWGHIDKRLWEWLKKSR